MLAQRTSNPTSFSFMPGDIYVRYLLSRCAGGPSGGRDWRVGGGRRGAEDPRMYSQNGRVQRHRRGNTTPKRAVWGINESEKSPGKAFCCNRWRANLQNGKMLDREY